MAVVYKPTTLPTEKWVSYRHFMALQIKYEQLNVQALDNGCNAKLIVQAKRKLNAMQVWYTKAYGNSVD